MHIRLFSLIAPAFLVVGLLSTCGQDIRPQSALTPTPPVVPEADEPAAPTIDEDEVREKEKNTFVTLKTDKGDIVFKLLPDEAPLAVANFVGLAEGIHPFRDLETGQIVKRPFYDGLTFHRADAGFMIQGGDPLGDGTGGPGYKFLCEPAQRDYDPGIVAMARTADPVSNGSQFFIVHQDASHLEKTYSILGKVVTGMDVVDRIATSPVEGDRLAPAIKIIKVTVERKKPSDG